MEPSLTNDRNRIDLPEEFGMITLGERILESVAVALSR
jgi:hypothetical protein